MYLDKADTVTMATLQWPYLMLHGLKKLMRSQILLVGVKRVKYPLVQPKATSL